MKQTNKDVVERMTRTLLEAIVFNHQEVTISAKLEDGRLLTMKATLKPAAIDVRINALNADTVGEQK